MRIKLGRPMRLAVIAQYAACTLFYADDGDCQVAINYVTTDSREVMPGDLFIALRTASDDGHLYLAEAASRGAAAALISEEARDTAPNICLLTAGDPMEALVCLATRYAREVPHHTVAITGSVGKTTTRRLIACLLRERYKTHESCKNYNNLLGTALTLLAMPPETTHLVAECGMDAEGQISRLSEVLVPDVAIITGIGISHLEKLRTKEAICRAKLEILDGMGSDKILFCPSAEPLLCNLIPCMPRTFSVGDSGADYYVEESARLGFGIRFSVRHPGGSLLRLYVPLLSDALLTDAVAAVAVALHMGLSEEDIRRGLARYRAPAMRQTIERVGDVLLLVDCYNACPASMQAATDAALHLCEEANGHLVALLGDMEELGPMTESGHREVGAQMAAVAKKIFCIGRYATLYASALPQQLADRVTVYPEDVEEEIPAAAVAAALCPSDVLLVKGSRRAHLESFLPRIREKLL